MPTQRAFEWPPKSGDATIEDDSTGAVWNPPSPSPSPQSILDETLGCAGSRFGEAWRRIESAWLGFESEPLRQRLDHAGWRPDALDSWCPRCGQPTGPNEVSIEDGVPACHACAGVRLRWDRAVRLGVYEPPLSTLIHEVKFSGWRKLGHDLGRLLGAAARASIEAERDRIRALGVSGVVVTPMPTTATRRLTRGIDHAAVLAGGVADELRRVAPRGVESVGFERLLARVGRKPQRTVPASERERNVRGSIRLRGPVDGPGELVLVIDDVTTTGASLREACRVLRAGAYSGGVTKGPELWVAAAAWPRAR